MLVQYWHCAAGFHLENLTGGGGGGVWGLHTRLRKIFGGQKFAASRGLLGGSGGMPPSENFDVLRAILVHFQTIVVLETHTCG